MNNISNLFLAGLMSLISINAFAAQNERVVIESEGWELIGDLEIPDASGSIPVALLLNKAAGRRQVYEELAKELSHRGIASLRLDLRGHGDSTNLRSFKPDEATDADRELMIWQSEADVITAHQYLQEHPSFDADRIAIVGASYSGEEMAEAGRIAEYAAAYVALSPGSFSDESIAEMDSSGASWLFIVSKNERYLTDIVAKVHEQTKSVEIVYLPGIQHATRILEDRPAVAVRIAAWLAETLDNGH